MIPNLEERLMSSIDVIVYDVQAIRGNSPTGYDIIIAWPITVIVLRLLVGPFWTGAYILMWICILRN